MALRDRDQNILDVDFSVITPPHVQLMPARRVRRPLWFQALRVVGLLLLVEGIINILTNGAVSQWINHLIP